MDGYHRRGRGKRYRGNSRPTGTEQQGHGPGQRHPPHLKGREIGLWYAARNKGNAKDQHAQEDRHVVQIDAGCERRLNSLLASFKHQEQVPPQPQHRFASPDDGGTTMHNSGGMDSSDEEQLEPQTDSWNLITDDAPTSSTCQPPISQILPPRGADNLPTHSSWEHTDDLWNDDEVLNEAMDTFEVPMLDREREESAFMYEFRKQREANRLSDQNFNGFFVGTSLKRNEALDRKLKEELEQKTLNPKYQEMLKFRQKLPSYNMQQEIVAAVEAHQVVVISGETGCGKTTQVPQFILDHYLTQGRGSACRIVCTQPRRISAISVAERVARERAEPCGDNSSVGYQIRLEKKASRNQGSMLFCTTGILLQWLSSDPHLCEVTHIVLDEIHERDLHSDFLMIVLRDLLTLRGDLRLILMSATLNAQQFSHYFNDCPTLHIPGFTFPVREYVLEEVIDLLRWRFNDPPQGKPTRPRLYGSKRRGEVEAQQQYLAWCDSGLPVNPRTVQVLKNMDHHDVHVQLIADLVEHIVATKEDGAVLVFVPGWTHISKVIKLLEEKPRLRGGQSLLIPLHSMMPTVNQKEVFNRPPPGVRKVIVATNIAETSITIDDIVYVIDGGKIKMTNYDADSNLATLQPEWVSRANARQRAGRAGRVQPGECYHLYTSHHESLFTDYQLPEMLRTRLEELCLQVKLLKLGLIEPFVQKAMNPPSLVALSHSVDLLRALNALDVNEDLTPLGYHLAKMPLDPQTGKMILFGAILGCLDPVLTIAASLSFKDAFYIPMGKEKEADQMRKKIAGGCHSDHIMLARAYQGWEQACSRGTQRQYCWEHFLSEHTLKLLREMRQQFASLLYNMGFLESANCKDPRSNVNSGNSQVTCAVICAGLYPNVIKYRENTRRSRFCGGKMSSKTEHKGLSFHPKSVNDQALGFTSVWFVYHLKLKSSKIFIHDSTMVTPMSLLFFGGNYTIKKEKSQDLIVIDDWIEFKSSTNTISLIRQLRGRLDQLLEAKITSPAPTDWQPTSEEGALMRAIIDLVTTEECVVPTRKVDHKHTARRTEQQRMYFEQRYQPV